MKTRFVLGVCVVCVASALAQDKPRAESRTQSQAETRPFTPVVTIDTGPVRGVVIDEATGVRHFLGIPYAAPPVGALRWKPPQPATPWTAVRDCLAYGAVCPQPMPGIAAGAMSEDCLTLNVFTPTPPPPKTRLPVVVWIHGGGFFLGSGTWGFFSPVPVVSQGIVFVSMNYRLGIFGFLAHPALSAEAPNHTSGNYGFLDQVAALKWVHRNIAAFGGDPDNVTIYGESAGGVSVGCHLVSPLSAGLFHRAALSSGAAIVGRASLRRTGNDVIQAGAEDTGSGLVARLKLPPTVDAITAMRAMSATALVTATSPAILPGLGGDYLGPVVDGVALPAAPETLMAAGRFNRVPIIVGTNSGDGLLFNSVMPIKTLDDYGRQMRLFFPADADAILKVFPARDAAAARDAVQDFFTVAVFAGPARRTAMLAAAAGVPVYLYQFTRTPSLSGLFVRGAAHGVDVMYVLGGVDHAAFAAADHRLSRAMMGAWVSFARTGNPNADGLAAWPRYDAKTDRHLEFGSFVKPGTALWRAQCDVVDKAIRHLFGQA